MKFQQFSPPVQAKGLEDTSFYRFNVLTSLNEVGGDPGRFGTSVDEFHGGNRVRLERWPRELMATATHDTKRGEDARIAVERAVGDAGVVAAQRGGVAEDQRHPSDGGRSGVRARRERRISLLPGARRRMAGRARSMRRSRRRRRLSSWRDCARSCRRPLKKPRRTRVGSIRVARTRMRSRALLKRRCADRRRERFLKSFVPFVRRRLGRRDGEFAGAARPEGRLAGRPRLLSRDGILAAGHGRSRQSAPCRFSGARIDTRRVDADRSSARKDPTARRWRRVDAIRRWKRLSPTCSTTGRTRESRCS